MKVYDWLEQNENLENDEFFITPLAKFSVTLYIFKRNFTYV